MINISAGIMKIPQHDPSIQTMKAWLIKKYAGFIYDWATETRLSEKDVEVKRRFLNRILKHIEIARHDEDVAKGFKNLTIPKIYEDGSYRNEPVSLYFDGEKWGLDLNNVRIVSSRKIYMPLNTLKHIIENALSKLAPTSSKQISDFTLLSKLTFQESNGKSYTHQQMVEVFISVEPALWKEYGIPENIQPQQIQLILTSKGNWPTVKGNPMGLFYPVGKQNIPAIVILMDQELLMPKNIQEYNMFKSELLYNLEHEIRHMVQFFVDYSKHLTPGSAGMLKDKLRSREHNYEGFSKKDNSELPHNLRDIEFQTRLADEISAVKHFYPEIGPFNIDQIFKAQIKTRPFFQTLLAAHPERWREAVKQFYKGLHDLSGKEQRASDIKIEPKWQHYDFFNFLPSHKEAPPAFMLPPEARMAWPKNAPFELMKNNIPSNVDEFVLVANLVHRFNLKGNFVKFKEINDDVFYFIPKKINNHPTSEIIRNLLREHPELKKSLGYDELRGMAIRVEEGLKENYRYSAQEEQSTPLIPLNEYEYFFLNKYSNELGLGNVSERIGGGFYLPSYLVDNYGRKIKVGKFLSLIERKYNLLPYEEEYMQSIKKKYETTPKITNWILVVSAEPSDILTMSGRQGWTSCIAPGEINYHMLDQACSNGDMVAYAINPNTKQWLVRVWLRYDGKGKWWQEPKVYGQPSSINFSDFKEKVDEWLADRNLLGRQGDFSPETIGWSDYWQGHVPPLLPEEEEQEEETPKKSEEIGAYLVKLNFDKLDELYPEIKFNLYSASSISRQILFSITNNVSYRPYEEGEWIVYATPEQIRKIRAMPQFDVLKKYFPEEKNILRKLI